MLKACEEYVDKLGMGLWQTGFLYTAYAQVGNIIESTRYLYTRTGTGFAQFYSAFTQVFLTTFNLLRVFLYTVSTVPINNTNLIKDLCL